MGKRFTTYLMMLSVSIALGLILKYGNISINSLVHHTPETSFYVTLFSTISTLLASIFALIFIVLTLSIQMSNKYSSFSLFVNRETKFLMCIYFVTIIFSLFMILWGYYFPVLALTLTTFCILSLYPFLYSMNLKISYEVAVEKLGEEILEFIDSKKTASAIHRTIELGHIGIKAMDENHSPIIEKIIDINIAGLELASKNELNTVIEVIGTQLIHISNKIAKDYNADLTEKILKAVRSYILLVKDTETATFIEQQRIIKETGIKFIQNKFNEEYIVLIENILFLSVEETYEKIWHQNENAIVYLGQISKASIEKSLKISLLGAASFLFLIGELIYERKLEIEGKITDSIKNRRHENLSPLGEEETQINKCISLIINQLREIENELGYDKFSQLYEDCKNYEYINRKYPGLASKLDEFYGWYSAFR